MIPIENINSEILQKRLNRKLNYNAYKRIIKMKNIYEVLKIEFPIKTETDYMARIIEKMEDFELRYKMHSIEFREKYKNKEIKYRFGDNGILVNYDYDDWNFYCEMYIREYGSLYNKVLKYNNDH